jgi:hypothetical protein
MHVPFSLSRIIMSGLLLGIIIIIIINFSFVIDLCTVKFAL